jgi:8-oxo-dGTP pyrophosphatase MutT (NUDIX family)
MKERLALDPEREMPPGIEAVRTALERRLPGGEAQALMAPAYRAGLFPAASAQDGARDAAVLILLYPRGDALLFALTRRPEAMRHHKGQISLPGGAREGAETPEETAVREAREEIGVDPGKVEILGRLSSLYVPPSNFLIVPVVAWAARRPDFALDAREVDELIEASLDTLLDPVSKRCEEWELQGRKWPVPHYRFGTNKVWGATAMILSEFAAMLDCAAASGR